MTTDLHLPWRCWRCNAHGTVHFGPGEACDEVFLRVVEAHSIAEPDCHASHSFAGLAVDPQSRAGLQQ